MSRTQASRWTIALIGTAALAGCGGHTTGTGSQAGSSTGGVNDASAAGGAVSTGGAGQGGGGECGCPPVVCAPGYRSVLAPGACCSTCEPCGPVNCPFLAACGPGEQPVTPPGQCCPTSCGPTQNHDAGLSGPAACKAAGGKCVLGGASCSNVGSQDCNPDRNPGGAFCCLDQTVSCTDANVQLIQASNYDQTCKTASDCLAVGEGNACYPCVIACTSAAINVSAKARYEADVAKTPAGQQAGSVFCGCPAEFGPCCIAGVCHADIQCSPPTP